jgi:orotate phosphoribosyltransferase
MVPHADVHLQDEEHISSDVDGAGSSSESDDEEAPGSGSEAASDDGDEASLRSGDIDSGAESDGYGDAGLSWEAVLASVQQPGTDAAAAAAAPAADAAAGAAAGGGDPAALTAEEAAAAAVPQQPVRKQRKKPGRYRSGKLKLKSGKRKR